MPSGSTVFVHLAVILLIFSVEDMAPPFFVLQIPADRAVDSFVESGFRLPTEIATDLCGIDGVSPIMPRAISDKTNQAFRLAELL